MARFVLLMMVMLLSPSIVASATPSSPPTMSPTLTGVLRAKENPPQPSANLPIIPSGLWHQSEGTPTICSTAPSSLPSMTPIHSTSSAPSIQPTAHPSDYISSALPSNQPSASPTECTLTPNLGHHPPSTAAAPSIQPSTNAVDNERPTTWMLQGGMSSAISLTSQPQNSCFVSTFPRWKTRHTPNLSSAFAPNRVATPNVSKKQKGTNWELFMGKDGELPTELTPIPPSGDQRLIPFLMYAVIPFVPSVLLSTLNDQYQGMKDQFNAAAAALPPNAPINSVEYLALGSMYNDTMKNLFVLLLSKRLALYFLATLATLYAGWRASMNIVAVNDGRVSGPGDALDCLNREILSGERFADSNRKGRGVDDEGKADEDQLFATLIDDNPQSSNFGTVLAIVLPLVLAGTLAFSYLTVGFGTTGGEESGAFQELGKYLPYLTSLPTMGLCLLFVATEFRWALQNDGKDGMSSSPSPDLANASPLFCAGNILALVYVIGAYAAKIYPTFSLNGLYLDLWPLQNGVNIAVAASFVRGLAPFLTGSSSSARAKKSIRTLALALIGITMFDAISVFGTVANAAVDASATSTEASMSVMESVARSKLETSSSGTFLWQPGLLGIILGHNNAKVTEALGLGDVVFPSLLVAWAFVADNDAVDATDNATVSNGAEDHSPYKFAGYPYTKSAIFGYLFGSIATEIVGTFGKVVGLPALIFLVPSCFCSVTAMAWSRNELDDLWGVARDDDQVTHDKE